MRFCTRGTRDKTGERRISSRTGTNRKMPNITTRVHQFWHWFTSIWIINTTDWPVWSSWSWGRPRWGAGGRAGGWTPGSSSRAPAPPRSGRGCSPRCSLQHKHGQMGCLAIQLADYKYKYNAVLQINFRYFRLRIFNQIFFTLSGFLSQAE